jgi:hypothetical protein
MVSVIQILQDYSMVLLEHKGENEQAKAPYGNRKKKRNLKKSGLCHVTVPFIYL